MSPGIDSSAYELLARLADQTTDGCHNFVISDMGRELEDSLMESEQNEMAKVSWQANLDSALEHAERRQLRKWSSDHDPSSQVLDLSAELLSKFESVEFAPDQVLMAQGAASDELLIVCQGSLTATRIDGDGPHLIAQ